MQTPPQPDLWDSSDFSPVLIATHGKQATIGKPLQIASLPTSSSGRGSWREPTRVSAVTPPTSAQPRSRYGAAPPAFRIIYGRLRIRLGGP